MSSKNTPLLIFTTVAKKRDANRIAKELTENKLAACVTILPPSESRYYWQGKLCVEKEFLLLIKSQQRAYRKLEKYLLEIHPYDCPEVLAIPASQVAPAYAKWLQDCID